jgi:hypothetical protein
VVALSDEMFSHFITLVLNLRIGFITPLDLANYSSYETPYSLIKIVEVHSSQTLSWHGFAEFMILIIKLLLRVNYFLVTLSYFLSDY